MQEDRLNGLSWLRCYDVDYFNLAMNVFFVLKLYFVTEIPQIPYDDHDNKIDRKLLFTVPQSIHNM